MIIISSITIIIPFISMTSIIITITFIVTFVPLLGSV